mmetsp:Transcript_41549/g.58480  ORF Transcript_41549/g.58480 Transcript_41549/m.58480 type:complete len:83 (-) Transcript_41549:57-305(-)
MLNFCLFTLRTRESDKERKMMRFYSCHVCVVYICVRRQFKEERITSTMYAHALITTWMGINGRSTQEAHLLIVSILFDGIIL